MKEQFRLTIGVDFHVFDGIFQGSRSYLLGIYREAIKLAPEINFVFFLSKIEELKATDIVFSSTNVKLVYMPPCPGALRLLVLLPILRILHGCNFLHVQYRAPLLGGGRVGVTVHDVLVSTHPQFFEKKFALVAKIFSWHAAKTADILLTVSEYSRSRIAELYQIDEKKIFVTYNAAARHKSAEGIDTLSKYGIERGNYWLTVGRLEPRKNHLSLIKAWRRIGRQRPLVIVGQRDFAFAEIVESANADNDTSKIILLENVDDLELQEIYRNAFAMVYPSYAEGFGMPILEAMSAGIPVIVSKETSMPEVAGRAAIYIDPYDIGTIENAMATLEFDSARRSQMVAEGYEQASKFTWKNSAVELIAAFRSVQ